MEELSRFKSKKRALWTTEQMENAIKMVQTGLLSQRVAAAKYKIPRRTLRNHLKSGSSVRKLGRPSVFVPEQEQDLVRRIVRLAEVGVPITPKMIRLQAFTFCKLHNIPNTFCNTKSLAGRKWLQAFLKRHPELSGRNVQISNPTKEQKLYKDIVNDHFSKVKTLLDKLNIENRPECIYNLDEKKYRLSLNHQQSVLAKTGSKRLRHTVNKHVESVTVVSCGNGVGSVIPAMILCEGQRVKPEFQSNLPPGSIVRMTANGCMTSSTFVEFIKHINKYRTSGPCLLIFDGAKYSLDFSVVEEAEKCGITLYCLPSNTTHALQPMRKAVYDSFEHHWDQELLNYASQHPGRIINKMSFSAILSQIWPKCMSVNNIMSGFRETGLHPWNPDVIPEELFAPSELSELRQSENVEMESGSIKLKQEKVSEELFSTSTQLNSLDLESKNTSLSENKFEFVNCEPICRKTPNTRGQQYGNNSTGGTSSSSLLATDSVLSETSPSASTNIPCSSSVTEDTASTASVGTWYCHACKDDRVEDMRQCLVCGLWYHELCVGLTEDEDDFYCCIKLY